MSASKTAAAGRAGWLSIFPGRFAVSSLLKRKIRKLQEKIVTGERKKLKVNLILIGDAQMRTLNRDFRRKDKTTDVLSFPLETDGNTIEGEIYISYPQAKRQAPLFDNRLEGEILRLAAHGLLHLAGYDHKTPGEKKSMFSKEEKYLSGLGAVSSKGN